jgi:hypothetical protein
MVFDCFDTGLPDFLLPGRSFDLVGGVAGDAKSKVVVSEDKLRG